MRISYDRTLQWMGEEMKNAQISAFIRIPQSQVHSLLSRSGRSGATVDIASKNDDIEHDLARIKLPQDLTLADVLRKIDEQPQELRNSFRGVVPSRRGYVLRVMRSAEAQARRAMAPDLAIELGESLGMKASATWRANGLPKGATSQAIIAAFAQTREGWSGWRIRPLRTAAPPRAGKIDWIVASDAEPPFRDLAIRGAGVVTIDRYEERRRMAPKAAPWFRWNPEDDDEHKRKQVAKENKSVWEEGGDENEEKLMAEDAKEFKGFMQTDWIGTGGVAWADFENVEAAGAFATGPNSADTNVQGQRPPPAEISVPSQNEETIERENTKLTTKKTATLSRIIAVRKTSMLKQSQRKNTEGARASAPPVRVDPVAPVPVTITQVAKQTQEDKLDEVMRMLVHQQAQMAALQEQLQAKDQLIESLNQTIQALQSRLSGSSDGEARRE